MTKTPACTFRDDVLADCADVAVGDAKLSDWSDDRLGWSVIVARCEAMVALIQRGRESGALAPEGRSTDGAAPPAARVLRIA